MAVYIVCVEKSKSQDVTGIQYPLWPQRDPLSRTQGFRKPEVLAGWCGGGNLFSGKVTRPWVPQRKTQPLTRIGSIPLLPGLTLLTAVSHSRGCDHPGGEELGRHRPWVTGGQTALWPSPAGVRQGHRAIPLVAEELASEYPETRETWAPGVSLSSWGTGM